jgi:hypothetical protein
MRHTVRTWLIPPSVVALSLMGPAAGAQSGREALLLGTRAYDLADFEGAISLLSRGLDPSATPRDNLWLGGVQKLAYALLERGQASLADTWLRWALRLEPGMALDSVNFPPTVWLAFDRARTQVANAPSDTASTRVTWQWSSMPAQMNAGSLVIRSAGPVIGARIENGDLLSAGVPRPVAPGSHTVLATADGYEPERLSVEVLPGVATQVMFQLRRMPPGFLYVASRPWGTVYLDGERIGYTTLAAHPVSAGTHRLRIERVGHAPVDTTIVVSRDQRVRLGPIRLEARPR